MQDTFFFLKFIVPLHCVVSTKQTETCLCGSCMHCLEGATTVLFLSLNFFLKAIYLFLAMLSVNSLYSVYALRFICTPSHCNQQSEPVYSYGRRIALHNWRVIRRHIHVHAICAETGPRCFCDRIEVITINFR